MTPAEVAGRVVAGTAVFVGAAVGTFWLFLTAETRRQQRNRELTKAQS